MRKTNAGDMEGAKTLKSFGIRPSSARTTIFRYLKEQKNHPTADAIYQALRPGNPTLSRTTVYNSLKLFVAKGAVQPVLIECGEMRFDAAPGIHGHAKCLKCDMVFDVFFSPQEKLPPAPGDFRVTDAHLYYRGVCKDCCRESPR